MESASITAQTGERWARSGPDRRLTHQTLLSGMTGPMRSAVCTPPASVRLKAVLDTAEHARVPLRSILQDGAKHLEEVLPRGEGSESVYPGVQGCRRPSSTTSLDTTQEALSLAACIHHPWILVAPVRSRG